MKLIIGKFQASHDGYYKKFKLIHEREIEFYPEQMKSLLVLIRLLKKHKSKISNLILDFTLILDSKVMKTQDNKSILIELRR